jgi:membrane-associated phospholipid phosphatase
MMPRLVAGAHWAQDDYIGGVLLALLALGWGYYTPFAAKVSQVLLRLTAPVFGLLAKLPVIGRLSVMRASC